MTIYTPKHRTLKASFVTRPGSSDVKSVDETWRKNAYQRKSAGFLVEPGERWVDMGANVGAFTVFAATKGAFVRAVEAQRDNAALVRANVLRNGLAPKVVVMQGAVVPDSQHGRTLKFYEQGNPAAFRRHTLYGNYLNSAKKAGVKVTAVKGIGFSSLLADGFDCVKMNIEGAELPIIRELSTRPPIRKLVFEYSFDMDKRTKTFFETMDKLATLFDRVIPERQVPRDLYVYPYFPPRSYVFCINDAAQES